MNAQLIISPISSQPNCFHWLKKSKYKLGYSRCRYRYAFLKSVCDLPINTEKKKKKKPGNMQHILHKGLDEEKGWVLNVLKL